VPDLSSCVRCARPIPADAPGGSCPACLLALALGTPDAAADRTPVAAGVTTATASLPPADAESTAPYPGPARAGWPVVPGYQILGPLGAGGGGSVYRARQRVADREVAVKVLAQGAERARFHREVRALATLDHPHVVRVYEIGESDQGPFFSMEFMPGGSLAEFIRRSGWRPPEEAAALVEKAARGVAAVHERGIIHRDLKPSNVLLDASGEPKVADYGLAKEWGEETGPAGDSITPSGAILGTPAYMAPEQAAGRSAEVGPRTDVYGLGATLYQALTGDPPFVGNSTPVVLHQVLTADPIPPRRFNRQVPRALEAVCLKCLEKDPAKRYESAAALADDLARWRRGEPTIARPLPRVVALARRAWRRRRAAAWGLTIALGTLAMTVAVALALRDPRPAAVPDDPDAELKRIREEVGGPEPVTLIGPSGRPRWSRGAPPFKDSDYGDGTCCVEVLGEEFIDLLPAGLVPEHFRLVADVRHERGIESAAMQVGVYFGRWVELLADGRRLEGCHRIAFHDWPPPIGAPGNPVPNDITYQLLLTLATPGARGKPQVGHPAKLAITPPPLFQPRGWRTLSVDVGADGVRLWEGSGEGRRAFHPGVVPAEQLAARWADLRRRATPESPAPVQLAGAQTGGAVGLYLNRAQASFRNVRVQRIDP
jgi:tRNA A-37 threonylcarbamoyl transferase component Bud32